MLILCLLCYMISSNNEKTHTQLLKELKQEEGFRSIPYLDTQGFWTIGYGRNIDGLPLSEEEFTHLFPNESIENNNRVWLIKTWSKGKITRESAIYLLDSVVDICLQDAHKIYHDFDSYQTTKKVVILDLLYNLGISRYRKFRKHIKAVKAKDWITAAAELLNSEAARQDPNRYKRLAEEIK